MLPQTINHLHHKCTGVKGQMLRHFPEPISRTLNREIEWHWNGLSVQISKLHDDRFVSSKQLICHLH